MIALSIRQIGNRRYRTNVKAAKIVLAAHIKALNGRSHYAAVSGDERPGKLVAMALCPFCTGVKCFTDTTGRTERTVPPRPANSPAREKLVPRWGLYAASMVLNEKLGTIRLVTMPSNELGPLMPRKARFVNSDLDASLTAVMEESS